MSEKKNENGYKGRFREIAAVLHKHEISKGITPEKLRLILEDLGPTFVKVGQLMSLRSDILPKNYCDELQKLCSDVPPMPFYEVEEVLRDSFGYEWQEEFEWIDETPLGSASIAQVHRARLKTGEEVVIKVQRKGIYETMARDIGLMHKLVSLVPPISITDMVDFKMVLNELWKVTQEEMNFIIEAGNMEEFKEKNRDVAFVDTPVLFKEYTTSSVIVMEYIDGYAIDDKEHLLEDGYDMNEIGSKYVDNFIKQVMDDGFFHADPHPGNVRIRDGKIVWIDMGMMGRLTERDREQIAKAVEGVDANEEFEKQVKGFDAEARKRLLAYTWGGNVRELKRVVHLAVLHTEGDTVTADTLEFDEMPLTSDASLEMDDMEKKQIIRALEQAKGNRKLAAALLGIGRTTLYNKIRLYGIKYKG